MITHALTQTYTLTEKRERERSARYFYIFNNNVSSNSIWKKPGKKTLFRSKKRHWEKEDPLENVTKQT